MAAAAIAILNKKLSGDDIQIFYSPRNGSTKKQTDGVQ